MFFVSIEENCMTACTTSRQTNKIETNKLQSQFVKDVIELFCSAEAAYGSKDSYRGGSRGTVHVEEVAVDQTGRE